MKYRKKPVVVEATQFVNDNTFPKGVYWTAVDPSDPAKGNEARIDTLEGPLHVSDGDWIITGVKGERYPCKPDVFAMTYEAVENGVPTPNVERLRWATYDDGSRLIDSQGGSFGWVWPDGFSGGCTAAGIGAFPTEAEARAALEQAVRDANPGVVLEIEP